jgi:hypothetical protein
MNLTEATALLGDIHGRVFAEVYKHYNYKDDATLRDYLDFVVHEPREWMRGFPASWKSASMFGKPRAAFHKLLKDARVGSALGEAYVTSIHDTIWRAFKEHTESVLAERGASPVKKPVTAPPPPSPALLPAAATAAAMGLEEEDVPVNELLLDDGVLEDDGGYSVHSRRGPRLGIQLFPPPCMHPELPTKGCKRCVQLEGALRALLGATGTGTGTSAEDNENARLRAALAVALGL